MTVNPNPKKMRPYDQPPKRPRRLIPDAPDSAATGFLVAGAVWFVIATVIGALALVIRMTPFQLALPLGIFDLAFEITERRVDAAFVNATVFGWLSNAAFAAAAFMTPRLLGHGIVGEKLLNVGLAIWNMALLGGIGLLYVLDLGVHAPLTAMPWFAMGGLATGALVVTGVFLASAGTALRGSFVSLWFAAIALLALLGLTGLAAAIGLFDFVVGLDDLPTALASAFVERAILTLWLLGMTYAILHYVVPRTAGQPLASGGLAMLTWLSWLVLAAGAPLGVLLDASVPYFVTTAGAVATMLLLLPASLAAVNLASTIHGRWTLLFGTGAAAMAVVAVAFLLAVSLLEGIGALRAVHAMVASTDWELGVFVWAAYGAFTLSALALAEHAVPRVLRRAWGGSPLSGASLWLIFGGATIAGLALMGGGLAQGALRSQGVAPEGVTEGVMAYRAIGFVGFAMVVLGGLAFLANVFLAYTSGEPADYVVPGQSPAAAAGH